MTPRWCGAILRRQLRLRGAPAAVRGGSWNNTSQNCRPAIRNRNHPDNRNNNLGLRLLVCHMPECWARHCAGAKAPAPSLSTCEWRGCVPP
jgi:hypothetical protein